jgi:predicted anti-sigma-YlaC factor YlaD
VTPDRCDHWHGLLAFEVVGQLSEGDRLALSAHLDGCQACRDERQDLAGLARILPAADPDHLESHDVPFELQSAVFTRLRADARRHRRVRGTRYLLGGAVAAVLAVALVLGLSGPGTTPGAGHTVALTGGSGVKASARLTSEAWGTAIHLQETGQPGGEVLTVSMRSTAGSWWAAGTYRTVTGRTVQVDLACGVPWSKIASIWVRDKTGRTVLKGYVA